MSKIPYNLTISVFKEGKSFVAYASSLDLSSAGKTYKEAVSRLNEAVELFFEETEKMGTTNSVLSDLGWQRRAPARWQPPVLVGVESSRVLV